jgi:hypothetical protein
MAAIPLMSTGGDGLRVETTVLQSRNSNEMPSLGNVVNQSAGPGDIDAEKPMGMVGRKNARFRDDMEGIVTVHNVATRPEAFLGANFLSHTSGTCLRMLSADPDAPGRKRLLKRDHLKSWDLIDRAFGRRCGPNGPGVWVL